MRGRDRTLWDRPLEPHHDQEHFQERPLRAAHRRGGGAGRRASRRRAARRGVPLRAVGMEYSEEHATQRVGRFRRRVQGPLHQDDAATRRVAVRARAGRGNIGGGRGPRQAEPRKQRPCALEGGEAVLGAFCRRPALRGVRPHPEAALPAHGQERCSTTTAAAPGTTPGPAGDAPTQSTSGRRG